MRLEFHPEAELEFIEAAVQAIGSRGGDGVGPGRVSVLAECARKND